METIIFLLLSVAIFYRLFRSFGDQEYSDPIYAAETVSENSTEQDETLENLPKHLIETIKNIRRIDSSFSVESFLLGASKAVNNIYTAAYLDNLSKYKQYIEKEAWVTLKNIAPQKKFQCNVKQMQITAAELSDSIAYLTVKFSIDFSSPDKWEEEEFWTFKRNLHSSDQNWILLNIR